MAGFTQWVQLYFLLFAPFALHVSYLTLFYHRRGFNDFEIGWLEAIGSICAIVSPLLWGPLADRLRHKRHLIAWLALGLGIFFPLLWCAPPVAWALVPLVIGLYLCRSPLIPLIDAAFLEELAGRGDHGGVTYGYVRTAGSVGFIVTATIVPLVLADARHSDPLRRLAPVFVAVGLLAVLLALRAWTLADPPPAEPHERPPGGHFRAVLALPQYKKLLALLMVSWISNQTYYLFLSLYLDRIGVSDRLKGVYWSMGVLAEIAMMAIGPWLLRRVGVRNLILAGFVGRMVRVFAFCVPQRPLVALLVFQPLHALGFAAVHLGTMAFLARTVPPPLRATGQLVNAALVTGLGGMVGNLLAGWVSHRTDLGAHGPALCGLHGIHAAYFVSGVLQAAVLVLAWLSLREPPTMPPAPES